MMPSAQPHVAYTTWHRPASRTEFNQSKVSMNVCGRFLTNRSARVIKPSLNESIPAILLHYDRRHSMRSFAQKPAIIKTGPVSIRFPKPSAFSSLDFEGRDDERLYPVYYCRRASDQMRTDISTECTRTNRHSALSALDLGMPGSL